MVKRLHRHYGLSVCCLLRVAHKVRGDCDMQDDGKVDKINFISQTLYPKPSICVFIGIPSIDGFI